MPPMWHTFNQRIRKKRYDSNYEHAVITARINTSSTPVLHDVVNRIDTLVENNPNVQFVGGQAEKNSSVF